MLVGCTQPNWLYSDGGTPIETVLTFSDNDDVPMDGDTANAGNDM